MDLTKQFDNYEVTNGQFIEKGKTAVVLGCTGQLSIEAETKTITKKCEGKTARESTQVIKLNGTFTGHMPVGVLRSVYGLTNKDLEDGVHGYGSKSIGASGILTFDNYDIGRENHKYLAFPNMNWTGGLKYSITNGQEEIAEIEVAFSALVDENGFFYYEAFEDDVTKEEVKTKWNKEFTSELVKKK